MKILYGILILIALVLIIAAILPKTFSITVSTTIYAPQKKVRDYVKMLDNQRFYSVRVMADPNIKLTYAGVDGTVGAKQAWDSPMKNVGAGEQEIVAIDEGKSYEVEIKFKRPMTATHYAKTTLEEVLVNNSDHAVQVTNRFWGDTPWPLNLMTYCMLPTLRKQMQQTMDTLKAQLEK